MARLRSGQKLAVNDGSETCEVLQVIGEGGQGEVYQVKLESAELALKWYFKPFATPEQRKNLADLISKGAPNDRFLWPLALVRTVDGAGLGYLMKLRPKDYVGIAPLLKKLNPSFAVRCIAGMQLADAFLQLHTARGLCYRDISDGNAFIHRLTGDVLICDNDNVGIDRKCKASVLGTAMWMAPEVARLESPPSASSDLYSLSVLLFYLFMCHHPLMGKQEAAIHCIDSPALFEIYAKNPLFIFDPQDRSNEPGPYYDGIVRPYWRCYPEFLRRTFTKAFTDGLRDPNARIAESEWRRQLADLQDKIIYCPHCGAQNFYDPESTSGSWCWHRQCGYQVVPPLLLVVEKRIIALNHDRKVTRHHLDGTSYDFETVVGEVWENPKAPGVWGLKNTSAIKWVVRLADGSMHDIEAGRSVALKPGSTIYFGPAEGKIVSAGGVVAAAK